MLAATEWVLLIELMSLAALPLAFTVFRQLPDRGYAFAKVLGLLVTAWTIWFVGMAGLPFNKLDSWLLFVIGFAGLDFWLLTRKSGQLRRELLSFFSTKILLILAMELVFVAVYAYGVNLHSYRPEIRGTEKPGDFAFLNSLILSSKLPPSDPWMSGYNINYYYFSHFMMALLAKMLGTFPAVAFNLSIPLVMGLVAVEAFGLVYNLVSAARQKAGAAVGMVALLGVLFIDFLGNLDGLRQLIAPRIEKGETPLSNFVFSAWNPSRVIWDYLPLPGNGTITWTWTETINEFPMFSYMLADMHPHVMSLPFMLLAVAGALNLFKAEAEGESFNLRQAEGLLTWFVMALSLGAFIFLNTWDYPTFLLLVLLAAAVSARRSSLIPTGNNKINSRIQLFLLGGSLPATGLAWGRTIRYIGFATRLIVLSFVLYLPFLLNFTSLIGDNPLPEELNVPILSTIGHILGVVAWNRTPIFGYILVFGVFIFPMLSFLAIKVWPYLRNPYSYIPADFDAENDVITTKFSVSLNLGLVVTGLGLIILLASELTFLFNLNVMYSLGLGLVADPIVAVGAGLLLTHLLEQIRPLQPTFELQIALAAISLLMIGCGYYQHCELYGPLIICITFAAGVLLNENSGEVVNIAQRELSRSDGFVLLLMTLTGLINFATELFFLRDSFNSRFNTLFKFYYQSWLLYGLAAAYCVWRTVDWAWNLRARQVENELIQVTTSRKPFAYPAAVQFRPLQAEMVSAGSYQRGASNYQANYTPTRSAESYTTFYEQHFETEANQEADYQDYAYLNNGELELDNQAKTELESVARQERNNHRVKHSWRWLWVFAMAALVMGGLVYTLLGPYEWMGHFAQRQGIDGEAWYQRDYPSDYAAMIWLRGQAQRDANFKGTLLEAQAGDWTDFSLVSTFSDYPTVMGWWGHEIQWRGGKEATRNEVYQRMSDVDTIYTTTDVSKAQELLHKYNVKYVYVGSIETSVSTPNGSQPRNYPPEALAKFAQFMHPIYNSGGVTIYSF